MHQKIEINFRFVTLLIVAFLLQCLSCLALQNPIKEANGSVKLNQSSFFEKGTVNHHVNIFDIYAESIADDEDELHNGSLRLETEKSNNYLNYEECYSNFIKIIFSRLTLKQLLKVDLPLFVLYQSWKSNLL